MPRNIKDSKSIARTIQCSSWASSCRTETCFSIVTLLLRKQKQICETLLMCAPTEPLPLSDLFFCIALISHLLSSLPKTCRSQNRFSTVPPVPLRLLLSPQDLGSYTLHHYIKQVMTVELKLKKLRNYSAHKNAEYGEQTTVTFCTCDRINTHEKCPPAQYLWPWPCGLQVCLLVCVAIPICFQQPSIERLQGLNHFPVMIRLSGSNSWAINF